MVKGMAGLTGNSVEYQELAYVDLMKKLKTKVCKLLVGRFPPNPKSAPTILKVIVSYVIQVDDLKDCSRDGMDCLVAPTYPVDQ